MGLSNESLGTAPAGRFGKKKGDAGRKKKTKGDVALFSPAPSPTADSTRSRNCWRTPEGFATIPSLQQTGRLTDTSQAQPPPRWYRRSVRRLVRTFFARPRCLVDAVLGIQRRRTLLRSEASFAFHLRSIIFCSSHVCQQPPACPTAKESPLLGAEKGTPLFLLDGRGGGCYRVGYGSNRLASPLAGGSTMCSIGPWRWHAHHDTAGTSHRYQGRFKSVPAQTDEHP